MGLDYRNLSLTCECGGIPENIASIGLSAAHHIVIQWRCPQCDKHVHMLKPLSDCWRDCPPSDMAPEIESPNLQAATAISSDDRDFLRMVGIKE